jgi:hypothetical protein
MSGVALGTLEKIRVRSSSPAGAVGDSAGLPLTGEGEDGCTYVLVLVALAGAPKTLIGQWEIT